ncbi:hypothetical protein [Rubritalea tangerina]|uniref:Uncharacterized protein n=1 Tax=Rubritalea tangerina TaxID=430798 RepID=A0ABW4ZAE8_9BACT
MKQDALWMRLREVDWGGYEVNSGRADKLPKLMQDLASRKVTRSMRASQELWRLLCSGQLATAAEPAIPFLVEIFRISSVEIQEEILDILKSCAIKLGNTELGNASGIHSALQHAQEHLASDVSKSQEATLRERYAAFTAALDM